MPNNYFLSTLGRTKLVLGFVVILLAMLLFNPGKSHALLTPDPGQPPSPSPPAIPTAIYVPMRDCYLTATPASATTYPVWVSMMGVPAQDTNTSVTAGTTFIDLDLNIAMASCLDSFNTGNQFLMIVRDYFNGVSGTVPAGGSVVSHPSLSPARNYGDANVGIAGRAMGAYNRGTLPLRFTPAGGFTTSRSYTISLNTSSIVALYNQTTGLLSYFCGGQTTFLPRAGLDDNPTQCQNVPLSFTFWVDVIQPGQHPVSGRVMNANDMSIGYSGVTIETCNGITTTTGANGYYSFNVPDNDDFCVRLIGGFPASFIDYGVRPWGTEGYWTCAGFTSIRAPNYCSNPKSYECQMIVVNLGFGGCGGDTGDFDRGVDSGYDFAFNIPIVATAPVVNCVGAVVFNEPEIGTAGTLSSTISNDTPATGRPFITITSATFSVPAGGSLSGGVSLTTATPSRGGADATASQTASFSPAGSYNVSATFNYTDGLNPAGSKTCNGTVEVKSKPYLKTFGADVIAGGAFNPPSGAACSAVSNKSIYAYAKGSGANYSGSSGQFGVTALLHIGQFYSASQRTEASTNLPPRGTSFANIDSSFTYGGEFAPTVAGGGVCITDYYNKTQDALIMQPGSFPAAGPGANRKKIQYKLPNNSVLSPGPAANAKLTIRRGTQAAVFINGNVFIERNIEFETGATSRGDMPNFALVVQGNIYIGPNVTRLDGLYIAQPSNVATPINGKIYTCASAAGSLYAANAVGSACTNQLSINGAVIAQQIKFYRTGKSLKDSGVREAPAFDTGVGTNAAEVISFTPEMYLAPSALKDPNNSFGGRYDAVFSLPPVL